MLALLLVSLLLINGMSLPSNHMIYFLLLSAVLLTTASFYTPYHFGVTPNIKPIITDYFKLAVSFLYFLIGYNITCQTLIRLSVKGFSYAALFVGIVGIIITLSGIPFLNGMLFFGGERYKGFMNDPNFFAIVQISALPFFLRDTKISLKLKLSIYVVILISSILSGSKTGFITLIIYTFLFLLGQIFNSKWSKIKTSVVLFTVLILYVLNEVFHLLKTVSSLLSGKLEQLHRISLLISDFSTAFNDGGSSRLPIWQTGIDIIRSSPIAGVGVGMYSQVSEKVSGINNVAHNTYLQFYSEWGIFFASIFFFYLAFILLKVTLNKKVKNEMTLTLRDIIIILLIGSIAISFNNARMFWFFIGVLVTSTGTKQFRGE